MNYTSEDIKLLRILIEEVIPSGGSDADTRFSDEVLGQILATANDIYDAASMGWTIKAGKGATEKEGIKSLKIGSEDIEYISPEEWQDYCLKMAEIYKQKSLNKGSKAFALDPPSFYAEDDSDELH
jgi:hypothetical protein